MTEGSVAEYQELSVLIHNGNDFLCVTVSVASLFAVKAGLGTVHISLWMVVEKYDDHRCPASAQKKRCFDLTLAC